MTRLTQNTITATVMEMEMILRTFAAYPLMDSVRFQMTSSGLTSVNLAASLSGRSFGDLPFPSVLANMCAVIWSLNRIKAADFGWNEPWISDRRVSNSSVVLEISSVAQSIVSTFLPVMNGIFPPTLAVGRFFSATYFISVGAVEAWDDPAFSVSADSVPGRGLFFLTSFAASLMSLTCAFSSFFPAFIRRS